MIEISYLRAPTHLQRDQVEITLSSWQRSWDAKRGCERKRHAPTFHRSTATARLTAQWCGDSWAVAATLAPLPTWSTSLSLTAPFSSLVQMWVMLYRVGESFTAFSFASHSLLAFLFSRHLLCSSQPSWTKLMSVTSIFCCVIAPLSLEWRGAWGAIVST